MEQALDAVDVDISRVVVYSPASTFMSVDFPAPFSPMSAWTSPFFTRKSTLLTASVPGTVGNGAHVQRVVLAPDLRVRHFDNPFDYPKSSRTRAATAAPSAACPSASRWTPSTGEAAANPAASRYAQPAPAANAR